MEVYEIYVISVEIFSNRDVACSEQEVKRTMELHQLNSFEEEIKREHYVKLNKVILESRYKNALFGYEKRV